MVMRPYTMVYFGFLISGRCTDFIRVHPTEVPGRSIKFTAMTDMKKYIIFLYLLLVSVFSLGAEPGQSPDLMVRDFYTWFIEHDNDQVYPLNLPDVDRYVLKETVNLLRKDYERSGPPGGVDYFLKVQDYDGKDWLRNMSIQKPVVLGDVSVVPVTFGSAEKTSVMVFVRLMDGEWRITKIDDTRDYR